MWQGKINYTYCDDRFNNKQALLINYYGVIIILILHIKIIFGLVTMTLRLQFVAWRVTLHPDKPLFQYPKW